MDRGTKTRTERETNIARRKYGAERRTDRYRVRWKEGQRHALRETNIARRKYGAERRTDRYRARWTEGQRHALRERQI